MRRGCLGALLFALILPVPNVRAQCRIAPATHDPAVYQNPVVRQIFPIDTGFIDRSGRVMHGQLKLGVENGPQPLLPFTAEDKSACGFKDKAEVIKVRPQFRGMRPFKDHMAAVQDLKGNWGFVDESGAVKVEPRYDFVGDFSEGLARISQTGVTGCRYIDAQGKPAIDGTFVTCGDFTDGIARVELTKDRWAFIDKTGKAIGKLSGDQRFAYVSEGLIPSESPDGKRVGLVSRDGEFVIPARFTAIQPFSEGLAAATDESGKVGYIDKTGKFVIAARFCDVENAGQGNFQEGLAYACDPKTHLFGFIDRAGKFAIAPRFVSAPCTDSQAYCGFNGGLALVETEKRRGYINAKGQWVWSVNKGTPQWAKPYSQ